MCRCTLSKLQNRVEACTTVPLLLLLLYLCIAPAQHTQHGLLASTHMARAQPRVCLLCASFCTLQLQLRLFTLSELPWGSGASSTMPTAARTASMSVNHSSLTRLASLQQHQQDSEYHLLAFTTSCKADKVSHHLYLRRTLAASSSEMPSMDVTCSTASFCRRSMSALVRTKYLLCKAAYNAAGGRDSPATKVSN
jgi:hypothetical protein